MKRVLKGSDPRSEKKSESNILKNMKVKAETWWIESMKVKIQLAGKPLFRNTGKWSMGISKGGVGIL